MRLNCECSPKYETKMEEASQGCSWKDSMSHREKAKLEIEKWEKG